SSARPRRLSESFGDGGRSGGASNATSEAGSLVAFPVGSATHARDHPAAVRRGRVVHPVLHAVPGPPRHDIRLWHPAPARDYPPVSAAHGSRVALAALRPGACVPIPAGGAQTPNRSHVLGTPKKIRPMTVPVESLERLHGVSLTDHLTS